MPAQAGTPARKSSPLTEGGRQTELFADLLGGAVRQALTRTVDAAGYFPLVDSYVDDGRLVIRADLPGMDPAEVETCVKGNHLTIMGKRRSHRMGTNGEGRYLHHEAPSGEFQRRLRLPDGVDTDKIVASYENGVLELSIPMPAERVKKVRIGGGRSPRSRATEHEAA